MHLYRKAGAGPDLVLLHGWGMHAGVWNSVAEQLAETFTVWQLDLPGYGGSDTVAPYTLEQLADALAPQVPAQVHLCGWSLGALLAQRWARCHPEQIRSLSLVGATPCFVTRDGWEHGVDGSVFDDFARQLQQDYAATLKRFLSLQARSGDAARQVIARLRQELFARGEPTMAVLNAGLRLLAESDLRHDAVRLPARTLLLAGEYDTLTPAAAAGWLARHMPAAQLKVFRGAAHAPFLSHPQEFIAEMKDFLHD